MLRAGSHVTNRVLQFVPRGLAPAYGQSRSNNETRFMVMMGYQGRLKAPTALPRPPRPLRMGSTPALR